MGRKFAELEMRLTRIFWTAVFAWILFSLPSVALPDTLLFKVQAGNPSEKHQVVAIRSCLPSGIRTNNVVNADGLTPGYDFRSGLCYVSGTAELAPGKTRTFNVVIEDVWTIPAPDIDRLRIHTQDLAVQLKGTEYSEEGSTLAKTILGRLEDIADRQFQNQAASVGAEKHIAVFRELSTSLKTARHHLCDLENLVLRDGQDPGALMGEALDRERRPKTEPAAGDVRRATFAIMVTNPSPTEGRAVEIVRQLPPEVTADDVVDSAGLDVRTDAEKGVCHVRKASLFMAPGTSVVFNVIIRDKWNVNGRRIAELSAGASNILAKVRSWGRYKSVEEQLTTLADELRRTADRKGPEIVGDAYVAFYRDQAAELDRIERVLDRLARAPYRTSLIGPPDPPPTRGTTWRIIFAIIGFLALVTLIVVVGSLRGRRGA